jgi:hypothetical protein
MFIDIISNKLNITKIIIRQSWFVSTLIIWVLVTEHYSNLGLYKSLEDACGDKDS